MVTITKYCCVLKCYFLCFQHSNTSETFADSQSKQLQEERESLNQKLIEVKVALDLVYGSPCTAWHGGMRLPNHLLFAFIWHVPVGFPCALDP